MEYQEMIQQKNSSFRMDEKAQKYYSQLNERKLEIEREQKQREEEALERFRNLQRKADKNPIQTKRTLDIPLQPRKLNKTEEVRRSRERDANDLKDSGVLDSTKKVDRKSVESSTSKTTTESKASTLLSSPKENERPKRSTISSSKEKAKPTGPTTVPDRGSKPAIVSGYSSSEESE